MSVLPLVASADARTDYMTRLLRTSSSFRVRAQAALSLGRAGGGDPDVVKALARALKDEHASVRTAAAAALSQLGDPSALASLRAARRDRDRTVRRTVARAIIRLERVANTRPRATPIPDEPDGPARYYVGIGRPGNRAGNVDDQLLAKARIHIERRVREIDGVVVAPDGEGVRQAQEALRRRRLTGYYIDSSIVSVERNDVGTRAVVSVIVGTYPGRDMRAMLQGAATVPGATDAIARRQAIEGAFTGALRRLPQAFMAADARARR